MKCIICDGPMSYYFEKDYSGLFELEKVRYWRCESCGFTASRTHREMPQAAWEKLNREFHADQFWTYHNPAARPPPYFQIALMLHVLRVGGLLPDSEWLDWGAGDAVLGKHLERFFGRRILNFDRFRPPPAPAITAEDLDPRGYDLVVNTAVFEHVRERESLDEIVKCVSPRGSLAVHTLVRGEIPADPEWPYLLAVHCAFHTNRSMEILMEQWGFHCSVYSEVAKTWIFFRSDPDEIETKVRALNESLGWNYLHFERGFMDYWP